MYVLPENSFSRRKHHEEMVRRLISNPESRNAANTYIYRQPHEEKERIVKILDQWDNEKYSSEPSGQVINKEAVPHIKEWCSGSSGKDLVTVKKFLQHLTNEQQKSNAEDFDESPRKGSGTERRNSLNLSSNRPGLNKRETITNGSFYPAPYEGRGNNTGMFNVVYSVPQPALQAKRPTTSGSMVSNKSRKPSGIKRGATQPQMNRRPDYFEIPTNRSGVFGEVIRPPPNNKQNQRPKSNASQRPKSNASQRPQSNASQRPNINASPAPQKENRPPSNRPTSRGQWSRPGTMQSGRNYSKIPITGSMQRSKTQGHMLKKHESAEKLKFSANLHNAHEDEIISSPPPTAPPPQTSAPAPPQPAPYNDDGLTPRYPYEIDVSRNSPPPSHQQQQAEYYGGNEGDSSHRPIAHPNKFPGRRYQPSQIVFY